MQRILFEPIDTLFFRDGRPYNMDEPSPGNLGGLFPPSGRTLIGALRAAVARSMGWQDQDGAWPSELCQVLGDHDDLGPLRFTGPFLTSKKTPVFPAPAHLLGARREGTADDPGSWKLAFLSPGEGMTSDLGPQTRFPTVSGCMPDGAKPLQTQSIWITRRGMEAILQGNCPCDTALMEQGKLWQAEERIGISRHADTRTVQEGHLYSATHIRLRKDVGLALDVHNLPMGFRLKNLESVLHPVGGEARMCCMSIVTDAPDPDLLGMPDLSPDPDGVLRYAVILLQPADVGVPPQSGDEEFAGLPGTVVSACLPKPVMFGGWNSIKRRPLPLRPHLAPGSVLFLQADASRLDEIRNLHGKAIGNNAAWGLGLTVVGRWPNQTQGD